MSDFYKKYYIKLLKRNGLNDFDRLLKIETI